MSGKELFEGMGYVDERFVDEAEYKTLPKRVVSPWIKVASMAACLCLIIFSLYNLQTHLRGETEAVGQVEGAMPEAAIEDSLEQEYGNSLTESPAEAAATRAPEMMVRILNISESGFTGTVQNNGGFKVFDDGTEITVTVDLETDPEFNSEEYEIGDLIHVMYTEWDENERTIVAFIRGIVDEPICD